tara:strand:+ start:5799 stop:5972 length:174 start_codon:yes stop_codon:yes gene_type:complete
MEDFMDFFSTTSDALSGSETTTTTTVTEPAAPINPVIILAGVAIIGGILIYLFTKTK